MSEETSCPDSFPFNSPRCQKRSPRGAEPSTDAFLKGFGQNGGCAALRRFQLTVRIDSAAVGLINNRK